MRVDVLPESWCVKSCKIVVDYLNLKEGYNRYIGTNKDIYYGFDKQKGDFRCGGVFGQLLTEEQFLYCISKPEKGEEIEVSNVDFSDEKRLAVYFGECEDGVIIEQNGCLDFYENYRRKPLVFKIDKWAKEKAAFADGKTIQVYQPSWYDGWKDCKEAPKWVNDAIYRIKPEPKYVPFTREDWGLFNSKEAKNNYIRGFVMALSEDDECILFGNEWISLQLAFECMTFTDGSIFGKQIENND